METLSARKVAQAATTGPDPSWKDLYRIGGISAMLYVAIYLLGIIFIFAIPLPPTSGGAAILDYIASNRTIYLIQQIMWLGPSVLAILFYLALYPALKHLNKSYAAIGSVFGVASWAIALALPTTGGGAPVLIYLSDEYQTATTAAQRTAFATVAEDFIAQNNITSAVGIFTTVAILIVALVMLKGVFPKPTAYLGVATGIIGIISEIFRPIMGASYTIYGLLLLIWFFAVGWKLYRLSQNIKEP
jgi:hypothetical protein